MRQAMMMIVDEQLVLGPAVEPATFQLLGTIDDITQSPEM